MDQGGGKHLQAFFGQQQQQQHTTTFKTKKDVDRHLEQLGRLNLGTNEITLRYFGVARAYASVREYSLAKRFLQMYIDAHPTSPGLAEAYKLMGDILLDMNDGEAALDSYKKSYEISPSRVTLNRVCDLLQKGFGEEKETPETMKEWMTKQKTAAAAGVSEQRSSSRSESFLNNSFGSGSPSFFQSTPTHIAPPPFHLYNGGTMEYNGPQWQGSTPPTARTSRDFILRNPPPQPQFNGTPDYEPLLKHVDTKFGDVIEKIKGPLDKLAEQHSTLVKIMVEQNSGLLKMMVEQNSNLMKLFSDQNVNFVKKFEDQNKWIQETTKLLSGQNMNFVEKIEEQNKRIQETTKLLSGQNMNFVEKIEEQNKRIQETTKLLSGQNMNFVEKIEEQNKRIRETTNLLSDQNLTFLKKIEEQNKRLQETTTSIGTFEELLKNGSGVSLATTSKPEQYKEFNDHVNRFPAEIKNPPTTEPSASDPSNSGDVKETTDLKPLSELFKKVEGSWTCSGCYLNNGPDICKCPSCETMKEGVNSVDVKTEKPSQPVAFPQFSFGIKSGGDGSFGFKSGGDGSLGFKSGGDGSFGFGDLAKNTGGGFSFGKPTATTTTPSLFSSPVLPIFGTPKTTNPAAGGTPTEDHEDAAEEFVPTAEFAPVIPLPPLVQVKKGDEDENTVYEVRAKLLRLHEDKETGTKEWKERGVGNIKILQNKERKTKVRIVMWREQIHKLACNHSITGDTTVTFFNNSEKNLMWSALDFTDGEPIEEIFVCKFGKPEQCKEFKDHVNRLAAEIKNSPPGESTPSASSPSNSGDVKETTDLKPLSELFKKVEGSWTCSGCYLNNGPDLLKCPSCETLKEGVNSVDIKTDKPTQPVAFPQFSFGFKAAGDGPIGFGDLAKNTGGGFSFGKPTTTTTTPSLFSSPVLPIFGTPKTTIPAAGGASTEDHEDVAEEFVPTAEFAPVIPLPPLVQVKKGDEDENTVYEVRAKLLRLHEDKETGTKEWKERGVGNIKILQNKERKTKVRIVMWREQIHKLACNHSITGDTTVTFFNNSEKNLMWSALDFTDGESSKEIFVCKFAKPEQCKEFKGHVDRIVAEIKTAPPSAPSSPSQATVGEVKALPQLSQLFKPAEGSWTCSGCYLNNGPDISKCPSCETKKEEEKEPLTPTSCPGCIGCDPDSFDFRKLDNRQLPVYPENTKTPEEYKEYEAKEKLANFSFSSPKFPSTGGPSAFNTSTGSTGSPLFSGFNSSNSFFSANSNSQFVSPSKPTPAGLFGGTGNQGSFNFGNQLTSPPANGSPQFSSPEGVVEEDDDEYEDDDNEAPIFDAVAGVRIRKLGESEMRDLGMGVVQLYYDSDLYCNRFYFEPQNTNETNVNHIICADSQLNSEGHLTFSWSALVEIVGGYERLDVELRFEDETSYDNFLDAWSDSTATASQANVTEAYLTEDEHGADQ